MKQEARAKRIGMMIFGVMSIGISVSFYNQLQFGTDPYTCMNYGIAGCLGTSFGIVQLCMNTLIVLFAVFGGRGYLGIGTVINWVGVGFIADATTWVFGRFFENPLPLWARLLLLALFILFQCFGSAMFFTAALGVGPYDVVHFVMKEKLRWNYRVCRILTDIVCLGVGFATGSTIGLGTLVLALCLGPVIQFFTVHCAEPFLAGKKVNAKTMASE